MSKEDIGLRGQWMFSLLMTELCGRPEPIFRPRFLGDKYPTFDYLVELVDQPEFFFFVQVKATTQGYTKGKGRLKIQVNQLDIERMNACPAPAYIVGIDEEGFLGYLLSANEPRENVASLTTNFKLECTTLAALADEVRQFWSTRPAPVNSKFKE